MRLDTGSDPCVNMVRREHRINQEARTLIEELIARGLVPETSADQLRTLLENGETTQALDRVRDYLS